IGADLMNGGLVEHIELAHRDIGNARVALQQPRVDVGGPDLGALGGQRQCAGPANALPRRGDQRGFTLESHGSPSCCDRAGNTGKLTRKSDPDPYQVSAYSFIFYSINARLASRCSDGARLNPERAKRCSRPTAKAVSADARTCASTLGVADPLASAA